MKCMHDRGRAALFCSAALFVFAFASPALSQTQQQPSPPQNESVDDENSEAIVVTAQKREQVLLDVPSSVTVVGGDTLERQQARSFQDYLSLVPGFSINGSTAGVTRITLRGANTGGVASTVAIFMDDVPFGSSTGLANGSILSGDFDPFDINRIEVLRGPQGTLYGASSFGGVIRYITNAPKLGRFEARGQVGIENTAHGGVGYNAAGMFNAPLGNKAAVRVDGFYRKDHGYVDTIGNNPLLNLLTGEEIGRTLVAKDINDRKSYGGRGSLLIDPTDNLSIRLTAFAQDLKSGASDSFEIDPDTLKSLYGRFVQSRYQPEPTHIKYRLYYATADWDLGFASLFSETSYSRFREKLETDATFLLGQTINLLANLGPDVDLVGLPPSYIITDVPVTRPLGVELFQTTATNKFTQEFRLASPNNDTLEWLIGAFYTHEKSAIDPQNYFATEFGTDTIAADIKPIAHIFLHSKYDEYAGFANATWHMTPRADLTVGGRLAHNKQRADLLIDSDILGSATGTNLHSSESVFTYSVAPRYELSKHASIYARVATGYRPGGPNVIPAGAPPGVPATYGADRLTNWEAGIKAEAPDAHLWSIELAAYHIDWKNIQLFEVVNQTGINANGGKARVNGLEFSGALRPVPGLTLAANGAYTNAKLKDDTPPETGGFAGDPLPWVPKWSGALHADYDFPVRAGTRGFVGASINYVGRRNAEFNVRHLDGSLVRIPSYSEVDLRGGVNVGRFTVEAFARNLFDKRGITDAFGFPDTDPMTLDVFPNRAGAVAVIRPRTVGLTVTAGFGP